jgi:trehalose utilization protein
VGSDSPTRVTVWCEELADPEVAAVYPDGLEETVAAAIRQHAAAGVEVTTATLDMPAHGLPAERLAATDVLVWWGHHRHGEVPDALAEAVRRRVLDGMGLVVLHSGHLSKPFTLLMGTSCNLRYREADDREAVWAVAPAHPIARGLPPVFVIPRQEMYGEYFDIPAPDELVFLSTFSGGEVIRSGCCFLRGRGRVFLFTPGHETYPVYHQDEVRRVIANGVLWARGEGQPVVDLERCLDSPVGWFEGVSG